MNSAHLEHWSELDAWMYEENAKSGKVPRGTRHPVDPGELRRMAKRFRSRSPQEYGDLSKKYAHAARYPWLSVAPDPPEPE